MSRRITVQEVARAIGATLGSREAWSIGSVMSTEYEKRFGSLPPKELRPKTNGSGSHCFATYPPSWEPMIRRAIEAATNAGKQQAGLF